MAGRGAGTREGQRDNLEEVEKTFREEAAGHEEAAAHGQEAEREKIAMAILGEGEVLSEELKEYLHEVEELQGVEPVQLAKTIEGRLRA